MNEEQHQKMLTILSSIFKTLSDNYTNRDRRIISTAFRNGFNEGVKSTQAEIESLKAEIAKRDELLNLHGVRLG
jgi:hypothetical protein